MESASLSVNQAIRLFAFRTLMEKRLDLLQISVK